MKVLTIPDRRLRVKAKPVEQFNAEFKKIIDEMFTTMYNASGVGLAATQVGLDYRVAVIDISKENNEPMVLANPSILEADHYITMEEGCLSVPGHYDQVKRANWIKFQVQDKQGKTYTREAEGLLAECVQHEIDHLDGKIYIDYLSSLKQRRIREKVKKHLKQRRSNQKTKS